MNRTLSTILIVLALLVVVGSLFFAGTMFARVDLFGTRTMMSTYGLNNWSGFGPGMMNQRGGGFGQGMPFAPGAGGANGRTGRMGPGMMGGYGWTNGTAANVKPLTVDQAKQAAEKYIQATDLTGLETDEVIIFDNNAYVVVKETATRLGAFELLIDPASQIAYPEYGPNMMWNLKYGGFNHRVMTLAPGASARMNRPGGMMNWMSGSWNAQNATPAEVSPDIPITQEQAIKDAQAYLGQYIPGASAATDPVKFYGYYTLDFTKDGKTVGMLSVNGYSGQAFLHTWHGTFIEEGQ